MKDKTIKTIKVDSSKVDFVDNQMLYLLPNSELNITVDKNNKIINNEPELFFMENIPYPITAGDKKHDPNKDTLTLSEKIFENFIEQSTHTSSSWDIFGALKDFIKNPLLVVGSIVGLIILYTLLTGGKLF